MKQIKPKSPGLLLLLLIAVISCDFKHAEQEDIHIEFNNEFHLMGDVFLGFNMQMTPDDYAKHCQILLDSGLFKQNMEGAFVYEFTFPNTNIGPIASVLQSKFDFSTKDTANIVLMELEFEIEEGLNENEPSIIFKQLVPRFEVLHHGNPGETFSQGISWQYEDVTLTIDYIEYPINSLSIRYFNAYDPIYEGF